MTKTELVSAISKKCEVPYATADKFVNAFTEVITNTLADGGNVQITGFGSFEVSERAERVARNPKTGEKISVAACTVPKFRAGKMLKEAVDCK